MKSAIRLFLLLLVGISAAASQSWGQNTGQPQGQDSGSYQGVSHPPVDDAITTATPQEAKPPAGHPMTQPMTQQVNGGQQQPVNTVYPGAPQQRVGTRLQRCRWGMRETARMMGWWEWLRTRRIRVWRCGRAMACDRQIRTETLCIPRRCGRGCWARER